MLKRQVFALPAFRSKVTVAEVKLYTQSLQLVLTWDPIKVSTVSSSGSSFDPPAHFVIDSQPQPLPPMVIRNCQLPIDTEVIVVQQDMIDSPSASAPVVLPGPSSTPDLGRPVWQTIKTAESGRSTGQQRDSDRPRPIRTQGRRYRPEVSHDHRPAPRQNGLVRLASSNTPVRSAHTDTVDQHPDVPTHHATDITHQYLLWGSHTWECFLDISQNRVYSFPTSFTSPTSLDTSWVGC